MEQKVSQKFELQAELLNRAVNGLADKMLDFMRKMDVCEFSLTNGKGVYLHFCVIEERLNVIVGVNRISDNVQTFEQIGGPFNIRKNDFGIVHPISINSKLILLDSKKDIFQKLAKIQSCIGGRFQTINLK